MGYSCSGTMVTSVMPMSCRTCVTGTRPVRYKGVDHDYALTKNALTKLTTEEAKSLTMLDAVTGPGGKVHFAVSKDEMDTFEKRVLPALLSCPGIHVRKEKKRE